MMLGFLFSDFSLYDSLCCHCEVTSVMSDSVRQHPWDSPGKTTGVG